MHEPDPSFRDWVLNGRLAPYVREHRLAVDTAFMAECAQPAGDMSDPSVESMVLGTLISDGIRMRADFGGGLADSQSQAGDLFLVPPRFATRIHVFNPHVIRVVALPVATMLPLLQGARPNNDAFDFGRLHQVPFKSDFVMSMFDRLWNHAACGDAASRLAAEGAILSITAELLHEADRKVDAPRGGLAPAHLRRVTDYLQAHLADDVPLAALAELVGLSPFHLCRAFRQSTGLPPHRWRLARRMEKAADLLVRTAQPVTDIAASVGYDDPSQLAAAFRKATGLSPSQYRRQRRS